MPGGRGTSWRIGSMVAGPCCSRWVKVRYWDRDGMCIWYKRLERGRFHFPAADAGSLELTPGQLQMILDGVDVEHLRRFKRYQRLQPA